jgi:hypothetical protein
MSTRRENLYFWGVMRSRRVGLSTVSRLSGQCGILNFSLPYRPSFAVFLLLGIIYHLCRLLYLPLGQRITFTSRLEARCGLCLPAAWKSGCCRRECVVGTLRHRSAWRGTPPWTWAHGGTWRLASLRKIAGVTPSAANVACRHPQLPR